MDNEKIWYQTNRILLKIIQMVGTHMMGGYGGTLDLQIEKLLKNLFQKLFWIYNSVELNLEIQN